MNWIMQALGVIIEPVTQVVKGYQERKTLEVSQADKQADRDHEMRLKKSDIAFELAKQGQQVEADWDTNAQNAMATSWKDEFILMMFSMPLVMSFVPSMSPYVAQGFAVLEKTPDWYMWLVIGIVSSVYSLRWMFSKMTLGK